MSVDRRPIYGAFARILAYPGCDFGAALTAALAAAGPAHPRARAELARFALRALDAGPSGIEELYTAAFDLDPLACPYVGHQLLGESPRRGLFLARIREVYEAGGYSGSGTDLPDHLVEVLRFLAHAGDQGGDAEVLLREGLVPALRKIAAVLEAAGQPYHAVIAALLSCADDSPRTDRAATTALRVEVVS